MTTTIDLSGRTAIVTGASNGIGRATAVLLAEHGATVLAADFRHLEENVERFEELGIAEIPELGIDRIPELGIPQDSGIRDSPIINMFLNAVALGKKHRGIRTTYL